jgi:hypothetical protein
VEIVEKQRNLKWRRQAAKMLVKKTVLDEATCAYFKSSQPGQFHRQKASLQRLAAHDTVSQNQNGTKL